MENSINTPNTNTSLCCCETRFADLINLNQDEKVHLIESQLLNLTMTLNLWIAYAQNEFFDVCVSSKVNKMLHDQVIVDFKFPSSSSNG